MNVGKYDWRALTLLFGVVAAAVVLTWLNIDRERARSISCTADAMICPDGSAVGRVAPTCEFAACPTAQASQAEVTLQGKVICLPHRDTTGEQTLECAMGLETSQGNYALRDPSPDYRFIMGLPSNSEVTVRGKLKEEPSQRYNARGTIEILSLEK